ncbi:MAG: hypothetical protein BYD32DRAFT_419004 [Podila humilis]|nr:MAG: hypothetical protein BYD32DRAFT_419004 [Podila humilis]
MPWTQWTEESTGIEKASFGINWKEKTSLTYYWNFKTFNFTATRAEDKYTFSINSSDKRYSVLSRYKRCQIRTKDHKDLGTFPFIYDFFGKFRIDAEIPTSEFMRVDHNHSVWFYFSSEAPVAAPGKSLAAVPTMADFVMERLHADEASQDILFVIGEEPIDADSGSEVSESEDTLQQAPIKVADENLQRASRKKTTTRIRTTKWTLRTRKIRTIKKRTKNKEDSDDKETSSAVSNGDAKTAEEDAREKSKDAEGKGSVDDEDKKGDEEESKEEEEKEDPVPERIVGAHKMVLSHWPFFKKMIDAKGGGPDKTRIYVRDVDWIAFRVLIRFLYTGRLPPSLEPTTIFADSDTKDGEISWEDLFLVADHCEVDELRQIALTTILSKLTLEGAIPFLFRVAHLHEDLRTPVVKYVATTCGAEISKKSVQQEYADHDECVAIFGEIITELHAHIESLE